MKCGCRLLLGLLTVWSINRAEAYSTGAGTCLGGVDAISVISANWHAAGGLGQLSEGNLAVSIGGIKLSEGSDTNQVPVSEGELSLVLERTDGLVFRGFLLRMSGSDGELVQESLIVTDSVKSAKLRNSANPINGPNASCEPGVAAISHATNGTFTSVTAGFQYSEVAEDLILEVTVVESAPGPRWFYSAFNLAVASISVPSDTPSATPSLIPSSVPSKVPSTGPSSTPSGLGELPSAFPSILPSAVHSALPSVLPSELPSLVPSAVPSELPRELPSALPSELPSALPSERAIELPSALPSGLPSALPSGLPSALRSELPSVLPSELPSALPSELPSELPSIVPNTSPSEMPSMLPSLLPSELPSALPSELPSIPRTELPIEVPSELPSMLPSQVPSIPSGVSPSVMPSVAETATTVTDTPQSRLSAAPSILRKSDSPSASPSVTPSGTPTTEEPSSSPMIQGVLQIREADDNGGGGIGTGAIIGMIFLGFAIAVVLFFVVYYYRQTY